MAQDLRRHFADRIIADPHVAKRNLRDVADGTVLVGQMRDVFDSDSYWQVLRIINVELLSAEWALQFSIENESQGERVKEVTTELGMTITSGKEVSDSVSASAGFSGWGFSAEVNGSTETKTFSSIETTTVNRVTDTYTCPPQSSIFVYKRQYTFRCKVWFFSEMKNAWLESNTGKLEAEFANTIIANQELISPVALDGQGKIVSNPPPGLIIPTKGFNLVNSNDAVWISLWFLLTQMYPWLRG